MTASLALGIAALAAWAYLLLARGGFWHASCPDDAAYPTPDAWPELAVIVPARDEADMLPVTLPTLLTNDYPGSLRILLVDDHSQDGTASTAQALAERFDAAGRVSVLKAGELPAGWKGKIHAMQTGMEHFAASGAPPRYVLFTDADIAYDARAITDLVRRAEAERLVLASLMVRLRCQSPAERFLIPAFVFFFQKLYPFAWVNDSARRIAAAAGGCMLVRYDALLEAGGFAPIRASLIDDCALGRLMKQQGPISLALTRKVHSVRAYPGFQDIRAMVARTAYDQLGYSPATLACAMLGMAVVYLAPVWLVLFAAPPARFLGALSWLLMAGAFVPMLRFYGRPWWQAFALPIIAFCYMGFTLDSAWQYRRHRGGLWKGRVQTPRALPA